jgi:hypothetical protein
MLIVAGDQAGLLRMDLRYASGHRLAVALAIDVSHGYPLWTRYSFQLKNRNADAVFRYDNAPHYPNLASFPDHKHVGPRERVESHLRPSLRHILEEVMRAVTGGAV